MLRATDVLPGIDLVALGPSDAQKLCFKSWSLERLLATTDPDLKRALAVWLAEVGASVAFAPQTSTANAIIAHKDVFCTKTPLILDPGDILFYQNESCLADGIMLDAGEAFVANSAGDPFIIAKGGDVVIAAHAERDSLIDPGVILGRPTREHASVVDAIVARFDELGVLPYEIKMTLVLAILPEEFVHHFNNRRHGKYNRALATYIESRWPGRIPRLRDGKGIVLDLEVLFMAQAIQAGVTHLTTESPLWTYPDLVQTPASGLRNLVIIHRRS